jgi:hypothetical protein
VVSARGFYDFTGSQFRLRRSRRSSYLTISSSTPWTADARRSSTDARRPQREKLEIGILSALPSERLFRNAQFFHNFSYEARDVLDVTFSAINVYRRCITRMPAIVPDSYLDFVIQPKRRSFIEIQIVASLAEMLPPLRNFPDWKPYYCLGYHIHTETLDWLNHRIAPSKGLWLPVNES